MTASSATTKRTPDLTVTLAGIELKNPVIAASGTFGYGIEFEDVVHLDKIGGFVVKGLSKEPMAGNPPPRLYETAAGMLNAIGLQNIGARAFVDEKLPKLREIKNIVVIANVFGYTREDYEHTIEILNEGEGIAAYELNVSCPNTAVRRNPVRQRSPFAGRSRDHGPPLLEAAADREAFSQRDQHRANGVRSAGSRRRCGFAGQHFRGHGHRRRNPQAAHCQRDRRALRAQPSSRSPCAWFTTQPRR